MAPGGEAALALEGSFPGGVAERRILFVTPPIPNERVELEYGASVGIDAIANDDTRVI